MKSFLHKIVFSFAVVLVTTLSVYAQVPQGFNFQAVARGANGDILADQALGVQVSIIKGTEEGNPIYQEAHTVTTNPLGLIQLVIGEGTAGEGQEFAELDFGNDNYFVKLAIDPAGGTEYEDLGTTRLLSVPYALVAQRAISGGVGSGDIPLNINLNTADTDSSLIINLEGDKTAKPFQVFSRSSGFNGAIWGEAISDASNPSNQRGTYGMANGLGTGQHTGVFGGAVNFEATGASRQGIYGQAASKAKFNYGVRGIAQGDGSGEVVPLGDEVGGDFGSYNIAGGFYSSGNLNGNVGVEAQASGSNGSRIDFGVIARAIGTGNSQNVGVRGEAFNSALQNVSFDGEANGESQNIGLRLNVHNGTSNIGMVVNADTAAIFNGHSVINGDLTVNGTINGGASSGSGKTSELVIESDTLADRFSTFNPAYMRLQGEDGAYSIFNRTVLQYGDTETDGTGNVYNWYSKGAMQVANNDYANGERSSGMSGGYFYMDIFKNENFYMPLQFGIGNAAEGGRSWFQMSSLARQENGKGELYNINISNDPNGTDPNGESSQVIMFGDESPNFQFGGQSWNNNDLAFLNIYGSTPDGGDWYHSNVNISVGSDGTDEWGGMNFAKTNISGQTSQEMINLNGQNGQIDSKAIVIKGDLEFDRYNSIIDGSISGGQNSYNHGFVLNHDSNNGPLLQMYVGGTSRIAINGNSGNIDISGSLSQSSDLRLKKEIHTLDNALGKTLKMRGVSYTWKTDVTNDNPQIGVIAQEVEKIYPEFVRTDENGMKSVNYAQMTAVLIEAVKALHLEIQDLKIENTTLQVKIDKQQQLEDRLTRIEKLIGGDKISKTYTQISEEK